MKTDRLIAILSVLMQKQKVTTGYLAEKFEVSRRTIMRDIEVLNNAGIPIIAEQGYNGGISVMENYKIDKTLLSEKDMKAIMAGLQSLDSVSSTNMYRQLMEKLSVSENSSIEVNNGIIIDLSKWDKSDVADKIELIKNAVYERSIIKFSYCSPGGTSKREIEPYYLVFQWSNWYVWGYCYLRRECRMFKLSRITELEKTGKQYDECNISPYVCDKLNHSKGGAEAIIKFDSSVKWRLMDEWGGDCFEGDEEGNIIVNLTWSDKYSLFSWIMSFGDKAEFLEPAEYRYEFAELLRKILRKYAVVDYSCIIGKTIECIIDRPLGSTHPKHPDIVYPVNYGYIEGLFAPDGEQQDVYVLGVNEPLTKFKGNIIAVYHRTNDIEDKWVAAEEGRDFSNQEILKAIDFQEKFFDGELYR